MYFFRDKVILITGASRGIGRALAVALAPRKTRMVLAARSKEHLNEVKTLVETQGGETLVIPTDLTQEDNRQRLVDETMKHWGRLDILVNNAGALVVAPLLKTTPEEQKRLWSVNYEAPVRFIEMVLPLFLSQQKGWIVNVASVAGLRSFPYIGTYAATKHALVAYSEALRQELWGTGVQVLTVCPGVVETDMVQQVDRSRVPPHIARRPRRKGISPERVARAVVEAIEQGKTRVVIPWFSHVFLYMNHLAPRFTDWLVRTFR